MFLSDLWEYNSITDSWTQKVNFAGGSRGDAAAFAICDKGYYGCGEGPAIGTFQNDLWEYNPTTNAWVQKTNFPGTIRDELAYFSISSKGYIGLGRYGGATCYNDFWEYTPDINACNSIASFSAPNHICPGTCTSFLNLSSNATSYQWSFPGATPDTSTATNPTNICYANSGSYDVQLIATNTNGSDTLLLSNYIIVYPPPAPQGIAQSGDTLFANAGAATYQWYFNGNIINGATNYFYVAPSSGD